MNTSKTLIPLLAGIAIGVAFVLSCSGDDSMPVVDAAVDCNCPAAEPPLLDRIVRVSAEGVIPAMASFGVVAFCELDSIVISGGCFSNSTSPSFTLNSSSPGNNPTAWVCEFYNGTANPVTSKAYVTCLKPAP